MEMGTLTEVVPLVEEVPGNLADPASSVVAVPVAVLAVAVVLAVVAAAVARIVVA